MSARSEPGRWLWPAVVGGAALGLVLYLGLARDAGHIGFPLDDAWIHQTYARNLAERGEWAFVPGQPSAGSTAPLWTLLLALGYAFHLPFRVWTYALGGLSLVGTALLVARLTGRLFPDQRWAPLLAGLTGALEWHLVWAAASGMETLLFALLALAVWTRVVAGPPRRMFLTGLLCGALLLTRPEGITAAAWAALALLGDAVAQRRWRQGWAGVAALALGTALTLAPYVALNLRLSGTPWPNTFYAKQAEYAVLRLVPLPLRLWSVATVPLIGAQALLVPGLLWGLRRGWEPLRSLLGWRQPAADSAAWSLRSLAPLAWAATTVAIYALRLPVTYQHGRYLIPILPVVLTYGVGGTLDLLRSAHWHMLPRLLSRALLAATVVLLPIFLFLGAQAYARDVAFIEEEMVTVAQWLNAHTPVDARIATHDIGAIGYFTRRPLLDLAGLVNPEIIPFIRDEAALLAWMRQNEADYLVTFPSWYPVLTADPGMEEVFRARAVGGGGAGDEPMVVYRLRRP
jgi:hypothetical protein